MSEYLWKMIILDEGTYCNDRTLSLRAKHTIRIT